MNSSIAAVMRIVRCPAARCSRIRRMPAAEVFWYMNSATTSRTRRFTPSTEAPSYRR